MQDKKVLVISYVALSSTTPNGRTMKSLLEGIKKENIFLFCCHGVPDEDAACRTYKVTNKNALYSIFRKKNVGCEIDVYKSNIEKVGIDDYRKGAKKSWKYLMKEFIWLIGHWKKKTYKWIESLDIDYILFMYTDSPSLQNFVSELSEKINKPVIVYSCEDYYFKDYNYIDFKDNSLFFKKYHKMSKKASRKLFKNVSCLITNSDNLGLQYQKEFDIKNVETIMMASNIDFIKNYDIVPIEKMKIVYAGAIGSYRSNALVEIADSLGKIDNRLSLDVYGRVDDKNVLEQFLKCDFLNYKGFVSYEDVIKIMHSASLLIETVNNDEYIEKDKKFGFSTKYADCFACGTPLLVYAPAGVIETKFAVENQCAFVVTQRADLKSKMEGALFNLDDRKRYVEKSIEVTADYFNKENNIAKYNKIVESVLK